jgi:hypothetical protein
MELSLPGQGSWDTNLERLLRNTVLHTLQHVHVGMWLRVKENTSRRTWTCVLELRDLHWSPGPAVSELTQCLSKRKTPFQGGPATSHHVQSTECPAWVASRSSQDSGLPWSKQLFPRLCVTPG